MHSTVERMDDWEYSKKQYVVPLLKELLKPWITAISPVKINTLPSKEWMTANVTVTKNRYTTSRDGWLQLEW